jgi:hypothetical protein
LWQVFFLTKFYEWGSRDQISGDRKRRSKVLQKFRRSKKEVESIAKIQEIESLILLNCSGDRKGPRETRRVKLGVRLG